MLHWTWRLLGSLGARGPRALALVLAVGVVGLPAFSRKVRPVHASTVAVPAVDPLVGKAADIDAILARKAPALGLTVRQQLAGALVEESRAAKLDPFMVLAVMRVESEFDEDALSFRGARGLMQVRPSTLAFLARQQGLRLPLAEIGNDPVLSTRLAIRYLGRLVQSFHGDLDRALMAYNAGPHRLHVAVSERDVDRLDRLAVYPRRVHRAYRRLQALPPSDDLTLATRQLAAAIGE